MEQSLDKLNAEIFSQQLHSKFKVHLDPAPVQLELAEVTSRDLSPRLEVFSLLFLGPVKPPLPQKIYRLDHEKLGTFEIFLTAVAGDAEGISYEAVFNRVRKKAGT